MIVLACAAIAGAVLAFGIHKGAQLVTLAIEAKREAEAAREKQLQNLLTRIQDPIAGVQQSFVVGGPAPADGVDALAPRIGDEEPSLFELEHQEQLREIDEELRRRGEEPVGR